MLDRHQRLRAGLVLEMADYEQEKAVALARSYQNLGKTRPERAVLPAPAGRTRDRFAKRAGTSARTVQDAATVKDNDPALFEQVKAGTIPADRAARKIRQAQLAAAVEPNPPLPAGPFQLILADPPWQLGNPDSRFAPENHYPTMAPEQIKQLPIPAAEDCVCLLCGVNSLLPQPLAILEAWGFEYKTNLVWVKPSIGPGNWARQQHELLLLGRRGRHPAPEPELRFASVVQADRGRHSQKPQSFYELIERAYPSARKLELFARTARPGWANYGNQLPTHDTDGGPDE